MDGSALEKLYAMIEDLPPLPRTVRALEEESRNPHANAATFAAILEKDPSVVTDLMKLLNSAFYCLRREVKDVEHIVALLGLKGTREHVMAVAVYSLFEPALSPYGSDGERHADAVAAKASAAKAMDGSLTLPSLLQDIGRMLVGYVIDGEEAEAFLRVVTTNGAREAERKWFGAGIESISAEMLSQWEFDQGLVALLRSVEAPHRAPADIRKKAMILRITGDSVEPNGTFRIEEADAAAIRLGWSHLASEAFTKAGIDVNTPKGCQ